MNWAVFANYAVPSVALVIWLGTVSTLTLGTWLTVKHLRHFRQPRRRQPISILKPLKGLDFELEENLESFFRLRYPEFELLFSVADANDPALEVVNRVVAKFPEVRARVFVGASELSSNPKVNNLLKSYQAASYDWILISDSNVRVHADYLDAMTASFGEKVGIVTALVSGEYSGKGFGAPLEATFLNTFYARGTVLGSYLGLPIVIGKSMLFSRQEAERFGGFDVLGRYLAEDYMAGHAMKFLGRKVALMREPTVQMIGSYSLKEFWLRHVRWGRIRKAQAPLTFPIEPFLSVWVSACVGAYALSSFHLVSFGFAFAAHVGWWLLNDLILMRRFNEMPTPKNLLAWAVREALALALWAHAGCGRSVHWRGSKLKLQRGGLLES